MKGPPAPTAADDLRARIRAAGLRTTAPRAAVLDRLQRAATPLSHAELMEALGPEGWDRATVYRNLADLTDAGLIRRTDVGDHVWRYEVRAGDRGGRQPTEHPHFMCVTCGEVRCLTGVQVEFTASSDAYRALADRATEVQLKGLCDRCA